MRCVYIAVNNCDCCNVADNEFPGVQIQIPGAHTTHTTSTGDKSSDITEYYSQYNFAGMLTGN